MKKFGLYIHIPFCKSKCPYCDFYSLRGAKEEFDTYVSSVEKSLEFWSDKTSRKADTLYIGGGTPSLLGAERLNKIISKSKALFGCDGEVTVECNPSCIEEDFFEKIDANRISLGMQSVIDSERKKLGRSAGAAQIESAIKKAKLAGISNISLDVMLGVPEQTEKSFEKTLEFCVNSGVKHISAYMLKIEEGTWYHQNVDKLSLPDDDLTADLYLKMVSYLENNGFKQYEISNFSLDGYESKHNLKYWNCQEYLGIGPAAHSFLNGKRFFYPRDISFFQSGNEPIADGNGGDIDEYVMLRLRLNDGLIFNLAQERFPDFDKHIYVKRAEVFQKNNLVEITDNYIRLTPEGFLISNLIIEKII